MLLLCGLTDEPVSAADWSIGGHLKTLDFYVESPPESALPDGWISSNRLRLDLAGPLAKGIEAEFAVEDQLLITDPAGFLPLPSASVNRAVDLEKNWNESGSTQNQLVVDRLSLRSTRLGVEWTLGRQAIGFGRIAIFSPLDVIAPFPPEALDTDVRPGVDALRGVHHFGLGGEVGAALVFGDEADGNSYLATFTDNRHGVDLLALAGSLRRRPMAGLGVAGSLGGLGLKGEFAAYDGKRVGEPGGDLHDSFALGALEGWYRFDNDLVLLTQYLYNGPGTNEPEGYPRAGASAPLQEGLSFLLGRHYLLAAPSYELHPLAKAEVLLIWNLQDNSFLLRPLLDLSLADNLTLQLFWTFNRGEHPRRVLGTRIPRSEFGSFGDSGGAFLRYFF